MAGLTGNLAARQRRQLEALRDTQEETSLLLELSRKLTAATDRQAVLAAAAQQFDDWKDVEVCLLGQVNGEWKTEAGVQRQLADQERVAATGPGPTTSRPASVLARCPEDAGGGGRCRRKRDRWHCSVSRRWTASR